MAFVVSKESFKHFGCNHVTEVVDSFRRELTLLYFRCGVCTVEKGEEFLYIVDVPVRHFAEYDNVVGLNGSKLPANAEHDHVLGTLEFCHVRCSVQLHTFEANETMT